MGLPSLSVQPYAPARPSAPASSDHGRCLSGKPSVAIMLTVWQPGHPSYDQTDKKLPDLGPMLDKAQAKEKKFYTSITPNTTIEEVASVMLVEQWPFVELLHDKVKCKDLQLAPWKKSAKLPRAEIRC